MSGLRLAIGHRQSLVREVKCSGMLGVELTALDSSTIRVVCLSRHFGSGLENLLFPRMHA